MTTIGGVTSARPTASRPAACCSTVSMCAPGAVVRPTAELRPHSVIRGVLRVCASSALNTGSSRARCAGSGRWSRTRPRSVPPSPATAVAANGTNPAGPEGLQTCLWPRRCWSAGCGAVWSVVGRVAGGRDRSGAGVVAEELVAVWAGPHEHAGAGHPVAPAAPGLEPVMSSTEWCEVVGRGRSAPVGMVVVVGDDVVEVAASGVAATPREDAGPASSR